MEDKNNKKPSWIKKTEKVQCVTFKKTNVNIVKFLDEGIETKKKIIGDGGTEITIEPVVFTVLDIADSKYKGQKTMDVNSSRLLTLLSKHYPLKDKTFEITAVGQDVDRYYKIRPLQ